MARTYPEELKEQVLKECQELGNTALVARRYEISKNTIYAWQRRTRKNGSTKQLSRNQTTKTNEIAKRLEKTSTENYQLKKLLAEKELELAILRELRDKADPQ